MSSRTNRKDQRIVWCDMEMTGKFACFNLLHLITLCGCN